MIYELYEGQNNLIFIIINHSIYLDNDMVRLTNIFDLL
jgi:hypothetical protein